MTSKGNEIINDDYKYDVSSLSKTRNSSKLIINNKKDNEKYDNRRNVFDYDDNEDMNIVQDSFRISQYQNLFSFSMNKDSNKALFNLQATYEKESKVSNVDGNLSKGKKDDVNADLNNKVINTNTNTNSNFNYNLNHNSNDYMIIYENPHLFIKNFDYKKYIDSILNKANEKVLYKKTTINTNSFINNIIKEYNSDSNQRNNSEESEIIEKEYSNIYEYKEDNQNKEDKHLNTKNDNINDERLNMNIGEIRNKPKEKIATVKFENKTKNLLRLGTMNSNEEILNTTSPIKKTIRLSNKNEIENKITNHKNSIMTVDTSIIDNNNYYYPNNIDDTRKISVKSILLSNKKEGKKENFQRGPDEKRFTFKNDIQNMDFNENLNFLCEISEKTDQGKSNKNKSIEMMKDNTMTMKQENERKDYELYIEKIRKIQNLYRIFRFRRIYLSLRICAVIIQRSYRNYKNNKERVGNNTISLTQTNDNIENQVVIDNSSINILFPNINKDAFLNDLNQNFVIIHSSINHLPDNSNHKHDQFHSLINNLSELVLIDTNTLIRLYSFFSYHKFNTETISQLSNQIIPYRTAFESEKFNFFSCILDFETIFPVKSSDKFNFPREYSVINEYIQRNDGHIKSIHLGGFHSVLLSMKGRVFPFGWNNYGQCGRSQLTTSCDIYEKIRNSDLLSSVDDGIENLNHISYISNEKNNQYDNFPNSFYANLLLNSNELLLSQSQSCSQIQSIPFCFLDASSQIIDVSLGDNHTVLLDSKGVISTFGSNSTGQLGYSTSDNYNETPKEIQINERFVKVKSSSNTNFALSEKGEVYMWPTFNNKEINFFPFKLSLTNQSYKVVNMSCGYNFAIFNTSSGSVFSFGKSNSYGELGHGDQLPKNRPTLITFFLNKKIKIDQISAGFKHCLAKSTNGRVYSWGLGSKGQLGYDNLLYQTIPKLINNGLDKTLHIAAGYASSYYMLESRKVYISGGNAKSYLPIEIYLNERLSFMKDDMKYSLIKIHTAWSKVYSILYATYVDLRGFRHSQYKQIYRIIKDISSKWNTDSNVPPIIESYEKYYNQIQRNIIRNSLFSFGGK